MLQPFGPTLKLSLASTRSWLNLGPGWAALAGALSTGWPDLRLIPLLQLFGLWLLVNPILGTMWELAVQQGLWRSLRPGQLPPAPARGFFLPYAQPGSPAGRFVRHMRRYRVWWREHYWPEYGDKVITFWLGAGLALLLSLALTPAIFGLTCLALGLTILAGQDSSDLSTANGGRLQSVVQLLLPWAMGATLWSTLTPLSLIVAICYWVTYLGGLRMLGGHRRANLLFWLGQAVAIFILLALQLLAGAALISVFYVSQAILRTKFTHPPDFLQKTQPYLVLSILTAGLALGSS